MKRYEIPRGVTVAERDDGEWVRYADHVEAMKRIAGAPVAQGLIRSLDYAEGRLMTIDAMKLDSVARNDDVLAVIRDARAILAQSAPSASAQQAEPVAWLFDNKEDGKHWYDTPQPMGRPVYAAPAPGTSSLTAEDYAPFYAAHHAGARAQQEPANPYAAQGSLEEAWQRGFDGQRGLAAPGSNYDKVWHEGAAARKAYDAGRAAMSASKEGA